jgi:hypothetical protein
MNTDKHGFLKKTAGKTEMYTEFVSLSVFISVNPWFELLASWGLGVKKLSL